MLLSPLEFAIIPGTRQGYLPATQQVRKDFPHLLSLLENREYPGSA